MDLARFWEDLETHFPAGGVRTELAARIGAAELDRLIALGLFATRGPAEEYPCGGPCGDGCPRRLFENEDGTFDAVCGCVPAECETLVSLPRAAAEHWTFEVETFGRALSRAVGSRPRCERVDGQRGTYRVGSFSLEPGDGFPIYFAVQHSTAGYASLFRALGFLTDRRGFGVIIPTDRHVSDTLEREAAHAGIVVIPLSIHARIGEDGALGLASKPESLLRAIGRPRSSAASACVEAVATLVTRDGKRDVTQAEYDEIVRAPEAFDIVIDQPGRRCWKKVFGKVEPTTEINDTYFTVLAEVVGSRRPWDPATSSTALEGKKDPRQSFQRMRSALDTRNLDGGYALLKTRQTAEKFSVYEFSPDPRLAFALLFALKR